MILNTLEDTQRAALELARSLNSSTVLFFYGNLGAGKTTFIKALAKALGVKANVTSPTFVGMNVYTADKFALYHFDLYQVKPNLEELLEIIEDPAAKVLAFEWSEKLDPKIYVLLNRDLKTINLEFEIKDSARELTISPKN